MNPNQKKTEDFFYDYRKNGISESLIHLIKSNGSPSMKAKRDALKSTQIQQSSHNDQNKKRS